MANQVVMRLLIQTGPPLLKLSESDLAEFDTAIEYREKVHGRPLARRIALRAIRTVP